ncbi:MAG: trigger factor [Aminivibrio sp.]|jgi:trigger factor|nr:trigger factor [Synergistaceae bacterium]
MRSEMVSQENNIITIKVEFEPGEFARNIDKAARELAVKANIPGFRKGRTPRKILEMRFGKQSLYAEALELMLPDAVEEVVRDYDLQLIDEPSVKVEKMEENAPLELKLTFEVTPEITLPDLGDISVERAEAVVSDETVEGTFQEILRQNSTLRPVEDRPVEGLDTVNISYFTVIQAGDGEEERHGPDEAPLDLSEVSVRNEIRDALIGKSLNEHAEAEVTVDENYPDKELVGKTIKYEMTVTAIKERVPPALDPEFFKKILGQDCETEDAFRQELRNRIFKNEEAANQSKAEHDAVEQISGKAELLVPQTLVSRQAESMKKDDEERILRGRNITMDQYLEEIGTSMDKYNEEILARAEAIVRRSLVLDKIADDMKITVEKEDFEGEMASMASTYGIDAGHLVNSLFKDEKNLMEMANRIKYKKTVKAIMDEVKINGAGTGETESPATED